MRIEMELRLRGTGKGETSTGLEGRTGVDSAPSPSLDTASAEETCDNAVLEDAYCTRTVASGYATWHAHVQPHTHAHA